MGRAEELNAALAGELEAEGILTSPRWRAALLAVPRHRFVPAAAWASLDTGDRQGFRIDRDADPVRWLETAYADAVIVTQTEDGAGDPTRGQGDATSSLSAPGIATLFGELLDPRGRVLEIGTGSGWTAGLLAHLADEVVSVEIDPVLAERAEANLAFLRRRPEVLTADAAALAFAPSSFDGLHVTCGVGELPWSWIAALRPGGRGVVPWSPPFGMGHRTLLVRTGEQEAVGTFHGQCGYMMLRSQRGERGKVFEFLHHWEARDSERSRLRPSDLTGGAGPGRQAAELLVNALAPGVAYRLFGRSGRPGLLLHETGPGSRENGSWALLENGELHRYGPRDLVGEVLEALAHGRPDGEELALRITPEGQVLTLGGAPLTL
ncbi:methyltransferase domain-containing protein [Actinocorallia longicatena]|uniref:Protein-L-isoaspartate O-methyltransferase n=1 Tax=Actinocorallia longicatena TaxID=111803 RepID=A0ABP6QLE7_9ACTN